MWTRTIGLAGTKGSGKTTIATAMKEILEGWDGKAEDEEIQILAFADPVRDMLERLDPFVGSDYLAWRRLNTILDLNGGWEGVKTTLYYPYIRELLQRMGTECVRSVDNDFWVNHMEARISDTTNMVIIQDVRFENEVDLISEYGGVVVELIRDGVDTTDKHSSEAGVTADLIVRNDSTPEYVAERIIDLVSSWDDFGDMW